MSDPAYIHIIYIRAPRQKVWDALTDPAQTVKFWFDTAVTSAWTVGAPVSYHRDGKVDVTGEVLEADPPRRLSYTFRHTDHHPGSHEEPASTVVYELEEQPGDGTRLTVIHDGFRDGSQVRAGVSRGWPAILSGLKSLLETGEALEIAY